MSRMWCHVAMILAAWGYLCGLSWENDGLWLQGDAPRHAINGLFWKDLLLSGSLNPRAYALSYYARYPAISPSLYPPAFYLLEALAFGLLGPSPFVAKGLVLGFALVAALYTMAWLRRWLSPAVGGIAALLLLSPGITTWAHAVMLNMPAMAIGLAALYHTRRALELPEGRSHWRHLYAAAALATISVLTYPTTGVIVFIGIAWAAARGRWRILMHRRTLSIALLCAALLAPFGYAFYHWAPEQLSQATPQVQRFVTLRYWMFYPARLPELLDPYLLALAGAGAVIGLAQRRWRSEMVVLLIWIGIGVAVLSTIWAKESRYLLLVLPALLCAAGLTVVTVSEWLAKAFPVLSCPDVAVLFVVALLLIELPVARARTIPSIHGFREVAEYIRHEAPSEAVLYDGQHNGVFTFYVRAGDPEFRQQVVRGDKLSRRTSKKEFDVDACEAMLAACGCRWLAIEIGQGSQGTAAKRTVRKAVGKSRFRLVRSFPITGDSSDVERVDVYQVLEPSLPVGEVPLSIDVPDSKEPETVEPIRR